MDRLSVHFEITSILAVDTIDPTKKVNVILDKNTKFITSELIKIITFDQIKKETCIKFSRIAQGFLESSLHHHKTIQKNYRVIYKTNLKNFWHL